MARVLVEQLLRQLDNTFAKNQWYATLSGLAESTDAAQAAWRPEQGGHTIYELVRHLAYTDQVAAAWLAGEAIEWDETECWVAAPSPLSDADWASAVSALKAGHAALVERLSTMTDEALTAPREGKPTIVEWLTPVVQHEAFHGGQIAYIRRLQGQTALI